MSYKVAIVDDHTLIAKAIAGIVNDFEEFEVLYEVENGKKLIERLERPGAAPDIVLLDISMPVMDGYQTAAWLSANKPGIKIMALTVNSDEESLIKMVKAGAKGYLQKNIHPMELHEGLRRMINTGFYFPDWATSHLMTSIASKDEANYRNILNDRETEFLRYVCSDLTYKEIAQKMFCSPRTIDGYRDALFEKLHVKSRVALALFAVREGIFDIDHPESFG